MILDWLMPWRKTNEEIEREIQLRETKVEQHSADMQDERFKNGFGYMFGDAGLGTLPEPGRHRKGRNA